MTERRCVDCVNYRVKHPGVPSVGISKFDVCDLGHQLIPCDDYQREPGADDDLESARERLKQREREIRESVDRMRGLHSRGPAKVPHGITADGDDDKPTAEPPE